MVVGTWARRAIRVLRFATMSHVVSRDFSLNLDIAQSRFLLSQCAFIAAPDLHAQTMRSLNASNGPLPSWQAPKRPHAIAIAKAECDASTACRLYL